MPFARPPCFHLSTSVPARPYFPPDSPSALSTPQFLSPTGSFLDRLRSGPGRTGAGLVGGHDHLNHPVGAQHLAPRTRARQLSAGPPRRVSRVCPCLPPLHEGARQPDHPVPAAGQAVPRVPDGHVRWGVGRCGGCFSFSSCVCSPSRGLSRWFGVCLFGGWWGGRGCLRASAASERVSSPHVTYGVGASMLCTGWAPHPATFFC